MRSSIWLGLLALCLLAWAPPARACKCAQPSVRRSYALADDVLKVRVLNPLPAPSGLRRYLVVATADALKGCISKRSLVVVETSAESASCGTRLALGSQQLLFTTAVGQRLGLPVVSTSSCSGNRVWSDLTPEEHAFLSTRFNRCGEDGACVGTELAQCLLDPCEVSECAEPDAVCEANYCGGCSAEWFTQDGLPIESCDPAAPGCEDTANRRYVARDTQTCQLIDFICEEGERPFFNDCGCGCVSRPEAVSPCRHSGCSGEVCLGPDDEDAFTPCVVRPEYACLSLTTCEPQANGACGFTPSTEYDKCIDAVRSDPTAP
jgi:eight-cysteine-cluster-containing protein